MKNLHLKPLDYNDSSDVAAFQSFLNENVQGVHFTYINAQDILLNAARIDDVQNQLALYDGELWEHNSNVRDYNPKIFDRRVGNGIEIIRQLVKKTADSFIIEDLKNKYESIIKKIDSQLIISSGSPESYLERLSDSAMIIMSRKEIPEIAKIKRLQKLLPEKHSNNRNLTDKNFFNPAKKIILENIAKCENNIFNSFSSDFASCIPQGKPVSDNALLNYAQISLKKFSDSEKLVLRRCFETKHLDSQEKFVNFLRSTVSRNVKLNFVNKTKINSNILENHIGR